MNKKALFLLSILSLSTAAPCLQAAWYNSFDDLKGVAAKGWDNTKTFAGKAKDKTVSGVKSVCNKDNVNKVWNSCKENRLKVGLGVAGVAAVVAVLIYFAKKSKTEKPKNQ